MVEIDVPLLLDPVCEAGVGSDVPEGVEVIEGVGEGLAPAFLAVFGAVFKTGAFATGADGLAAAFDFGRVASRVALEDGR
jgi:hypothetical protein